MADQLTEDQVTKLKEAFSQFDKNNQGIIAVAELGAVMKLLNTDVPSDELQVKINETGDGDECKTITFEEFLNLAATMVACV
jgi:Ca2+-binding EF-hand superfamily protein